MPGRRKKRRHTPDTSKNQNWIPRDNLDAHDGPMGIVDTGVRILIGAAVIYGVISTVVSWI